MEQSMENAVVIIGRFNPPTIGHFALIDRARKIIRKNNGKLYHRPIIVIVEAVKDNPVRNPLTGIQRKQFLESSGRFNDVEFIISTSAYKGLIDVKKAGWNTAVIVCGSDRVDGYKELLDDFRKDDNGKIVSIKRTEHGDSVSNASATVARKAVEMGWKEEFLKITGTSNNRKLGEVLWDAVKKGMNRVN